MLDIGAILLFISMLETNNANTGKTQQEIGKLFGFSQQRIAQIFSNTNICNTKDDKRREITPDETRFIKFYKTGLNDTNFTKFCKTAIDLDQVKPPVRLSNRLMKAPPAMNSMKRE